MLAVGLGSVCLMALMLALLALLALLPHLRAELFLSCSLLC